VGTRTLLYIRFLRRGTKACAHPQNPKFPRSIGAAWLRLWLNDDKGFGYIDDSIPELAIAVLPEYRGKGIGTELLMNILASAQSIYPAISLSVRANNPVVNLYQRLGFTKVDGSELMVDGVVSSFNMIHKFT
jgi:GNAT superfamily N-acetyltransferase